MNMDYMLDQIRQAICRSHADVDIAEVVTDVLVREGMDLQREPGLEDVKQLLVEACRTVDEYRRVAC